MPLPSPAVQGGVHEAVRAGHARCGGVQAALGWRGSAPAGWCFWLKPRRRAPARASSSLAAEASGACQPLPGSDSSSGPTQPCALASARRSLRQHAALAQQFAGMVLTSSSARPGAASTAARQRRHEPRWSAVGMLMMMASSGSLAPRLMRAAVCRQGRAPAASSSCSCCAARCSDSPAPWLRATRRISTRPRRSSSALTLVHRRGRDAGARRRPKLPLAQHGGGKVRRAGGNRAASVC